MFFLHCSLLTDNCAGIQKMQSKLTPGLREQPQELKRPLGMTEQIAFRAKMESNIQVGQTPRTGLQTQIRLRPGQTHFLKMEFETRKISQFRNNRIYVYQTGLHAVHFNACLLRHIARKAPIPCFGLLKHAAETNTQKYLSI